MVVGGRGQLSGQHVRADHREARAHAAGAGAGGVSGVADQRHPAGRQPARGRSPRPPPWRPAGAGPASPLPGTPPRGWCPQLELELRRLWRVHRRHPWLAQAVSLSRPQLVRNGMAHTDRLLRALDGLGLDANTMLHAVVSLVNFIRSTAVALEAEIQARAKIGVTDDEWLSEHEADMAELLASGAFPTLAKVVTRPEVDLDLESVFEFGLRGQIDALAVLVARTRARTRARARARA
ncbi:TetR/AcrR family transcriptional regulator C-terminal domain-containing protein [Nonomuraea spiralis]|uniref:TetR/AcrR family transcriptional regulator C-terminal domain-containing protein n=1 Tax=Nonomuraea spiralis TaxID=46182 RepID=UPI0037B5B931